MPINEVLYKNFNLECEDCGEEFMGEDQGYAPVVEDEEEDLMQNIENEAREEGWKTRGEYVCPDCREERKENK